MTMQRWMAALAAVGLLTVGSALAVDDAPSKDAEAKTVRVKLATSMGDITLELDGEKAPISVANFLEYARAGFYDGTVFHRVIPGFMIQGGGLDEQLREKSEGRRPPIKNEGGNGLHNVRGSVAMARTSVPDSATSQFFISVKDNAFLDRDNAPDKVGYAVFGRVVEGMAVVTKIEGVKTGPRGMHRDVPVDAIVITKVTEVGATAEPESTAPSPTTSLPAVQ